MFAILQVRLASGAYDKEQAPKARRVAKLMFIYPLVYTACNIPLAAARLVGLSGGYVGLAYMGVALSLLACNGWLDVLVYLCTRRFQLFDASPPAATADPLDTFGMPWHFAASSSAHPRYGNTTVCEAARVAAHLPAGGKRARLARHLPAFFSAGRDGGGGGDDDDDVSAGVRRKISVLVVVSPVADSEPETLPYGAASNPSLSDFEKEDYKSNFDAESVSSRSI